MNDNTCILPAGDELAARYVAGTLGPDEAERFELHMLGCADCRSAIHEAAALRAALRRRRRVRSAAVFSPALLAAAAIAWLLLARDPMRSLGRIDAPPLVNAMEVRGDLDSAAVYAARGLEAYGARNYRAAAASFSRAYAENPQSGTAFFRGISLQLSNAPDSALVAFHDVVDFGASAYAAEAHYYSAKAWLRLGNADSALARLQMIPAAAPRNLFERARSLSDSIRRAR